MSLVFVGPDHPMGLGDNRLALYSPLGSTATTSIPSGQTLTQAVTGTLAWWDASSPGGLLGPGTTPATTWGSSGSALIDLTRASLSPILPNWRKSWQNGLSSIQTVAM
jgi:hypothetical protein